MSPETSSSTKVCPTCGTRLSESATRCLVCGRNFTALESKNPNKAVQAPRIPEITLSLPVALGLITIILLIGAGVVFAVMRSPAGKSLDFTPTPSATQTPTITQTATPSLTPTPEPTWTALPPLEYTIKANEYCSTLAAIFNVSVQSIVLLNNLPADCGTLSIGQKILIPQPTPTASPMPTSTLSAAEATEDACDKLSYEVTENDTLSIIAANYNISMAVIKEENGMTADTVYQGQTLILPLCKRNPTPGPTPTATLPPPYLAAPLLQPADGAVFTSANESITLQWAAVGELRPSEAYSVTLEDITDGTGKKFVDYVTDTKFIVPVSFRPVGETPHIIRWFIMPVRQMGTSNDGKPIWDSAGASSDLRVFSWWGSAQPAAATVAPTAAAAVTPTP